MNKKILVLMSTYNGEKYISQQIDSILSQETNHEIILRVRDDGSKDNTVSILEYYKKKFPKKIELIKGSNIGLNASFFELIQHAGGFDYYSICDQDDVWLSKKLEVAIEWLSREDDNKPLLYASTSYLVYDDLKPYGKTREKLRELTIYNTIIQNICPGHTQVFNNALLNLLKKPLDVSNIYVYDSWIANLAMLYGKILFDNDSYTYYRQHKSNVLGYGNGKLGQLFTSFLHTSSGDGKKYRNQIKYFITINEEKLKSEKFYDELRDYINANTLKKRLGYIKNCKLYRQNAIENFAFYIAKLFGVM